MCFACDYMILAYHNCLNAIKSTSNQLKQKVLLVQNGLFCTTAKELSGKVGKLPGLEQPKSWIESRIRRTENRGGIVAEFFGPKSS